ncbi:MAG: hypothetical protein JWM32_2233 [Verrucomicrobia bacterium]|nr:hypothetical protein [Verrucomicrobiota bacterium]
MKLISLLSATALLGLGVSFLDFSANAQSLAVFGATASVLFLMGVVRDYAPRRPYWQPRAAAMVRFPSAPARSLTRLAA